MNLSVEDAAGEGNRSAAGGPSLELLNGIVVEVEDHWLKEGLLVELDGSSLPPLAGQRLCRPRCPVAVCCLIAWSTAVTALHATRCHAARTKTAAVWPDPVTVQTGHACCATAVTACHAGASTPTSAHVLWLAHMGLLTPTRARHHCRVSWCTILFIYFLKFITKLFLTILLSNLIFYQRDSRIR